MNPPGRIADTSANNPSLVAEFSAAAFDSALQRPINGLSQLGSELTGHELPQLHLVDVPKANTSSEVFAEQAGAAVGMLVPFLGTRALVRGGLGSRLGTGYGSAALEGGLTGLAMGTVFTPVDNGQPFWDSRFANGITDAGTFALLGVAAKGLSSTQALGITAETPLVGRIARGASVGAVSGLPAGFAHAELNSITRGKGPASVAEVAGDMTGFALFGGILGGAGGITARSRFNPLSAPEKGNTVSPADVTIVRPKTAPADATLAEADTVVPKADAVEPLEDTVIMPAKAAGQVESNSAGRPAERTGESTTNGSAEKIISFRKSGYIDRGDEGSVYSNGDGTVTKVFTDKGKSMEAVKAIFDKLESIGVRTPMILETGQTADGYPALRMEQVGDGDHLQFQIMSKQISGADLVSLRQQYYAFADALKNAGIRIDWQLKNMRFQGGKLYILDPSFLKNQPLSDMVVERYSGGIGPRD